MGYYDSEGFYYITGRKKRISKLFGIRINLDELERKIKYKSYDVACIEKKQKILIFYEKNYNKKNLEKVIFNLTNVNKNGFTLKKINLLPRNNSNKINYSNLINYES